MEEEHRKMSAKEARDHLRELRKEHVRPISKMGKRDVLEEIERLKVKRETTPPVASTPAAPSKKQNPMMESIKEAKKMEFPVAPEGSGTKKGMERKTARKAYEPKEEPKAEKKPAPAKKSAEKKSDSKSEKPAKGSEAMREKMARLRAMRKKKEEK